MRDMPVERISGLALLHQVIQQRQVGQVGGGDFVGRHAQRLQEIGALRIEGRAHEGDAFLLAMVDDGVIVIIR